MEVKLYVNNLSSETSEEDLRTLFAQAGSVISVAFIQDRASDQPKRFAFVTMGTQAEAQKAIDMFDTYSLADRELKVNAAKPRQRHSGNQSQLSHHLKPNPSKGKKGQGGYQGKLSAFGNGRSPATPRRRSGSQRY